MLGDTVAVCWSFYLTLNKYIYLKFNGIAQPDFTGVRCEQDTPENKGHKFSSDSERKSRACQEYQALFAFDSCRLLR